MLNLYREDKEKQERGSPCFLHEASFDVVRAGTPLYILQIEQIKKELFGFAPKEIDNGLVVATWLAEYGVTGWDGVIDEDDKDLAFNRVNARKVFLNPEYFLSLNALLIDHAFKYHNYLYDEACEDLEQIKKN